MKLVFRILRDTFRPNQEPVFLPAHARGVLLLEGGMTIEHPTGSQWLPPETAWTGQEEIACMAGKDGAKLLRWELVSRSEGHDGRLRSAPKATTELLRADEINLDPANSWLLRVDRLTFPANTEAVWHMHQGPGLRYVLQGSMDTVGPSGDRAVHEAGESFLENGIDEEVSARMDPKLVTSFARGLLLPRMLKTRGSTRISRPENWGVASSRRSYEIFSESYISLPS